MQYPKRLIEVDLPIKRISTHARREKSIRHGHISTLHIWWARRPLAACRAVICASLWPDPADPLCPESFRDKARTEMLAWSSHERAQLLSEESRIRFKKARQNPIFFSDPIELRGALLDFIADFANWDNSTVKEFLDTSRALTQSAHESLGGAPGTRPLVVDPFAGGGSIPLEALRVGADAFASDLNPVAVLLNKVVLEYIPKYGQKLADEVRKWGEWIKIEAEKELAEFYPTDPDGSIPIAYLWARTITCEGPGCGAEVPLMRSLWLAKKATNSVLLKFITRPRAKKVDFEIIENAKPRNVGEGTVKRGSACCPLCGYATPVSSVRRQLSKAHGGANSARLYAVVTIKKGAQGRRYRLPNKRDLELISRASKELKKRNVINDVPLSTVPDEPTPKADGHRAVSSLAIYGMTQWSHLFTDRQLLALTTLARLVSKISSIMNVSDSQDFRLAVQTCLAFCVDKIADLGNAFCPWEPVAECPRNLFARQALAMGWNFAEGVSIGESSGSFQIMLDRFSYVLNEIGSDWEIGQVGMMSSYQHVLSDSIASAFITDPPYYDSVPYAEVSDFFYVWLKRSLCDHFQDIFHDHLTSKVEQAIVWHPNSNEEKSSYEKKMARTMTEGIRLLNDHGIGVIVFAHKSTSGWEAILQAIVSSGWMVTASWPIDTEMESRMNARGTAALASSIHIVCRPRQNPDGSFGDDIGDWREVLTELPRRIHDWMPRLAEEGVVGADAIFACLGPALEIFSRYSSVEKPNGEKVPLREYLEKVWAAVSQEALSMVFRDVDTQSFEEDARVTAMWLWTLGAGNGDGDSGIDADDDHDDADDDKPSSKKLSGYTLEYDAARKISQGLGARLEDLQTLVEVKGDKARLLPVEERAQYLFGNEGLKKKPVKIKRSKQTQLFEELKEEDSSYQHPELKVDEAGKTVLDRLHQAMLLFGTGRTDALKRFLVEDGIGKDERFWKLAQAMTALYPKDTDERRWVEAVQTYKKGLGF